MNICDVDFKLPQGPVGILCSGGADSSLVLYLLMKYSNQPIHIFTLSNKNKNFTNATLLGYIIHWCIKQTGNTNIQHHVAYAEKQTAKALFGMPFTALKNQQIQKLYIGDTCWPPKDINEQFASNGQDIVQTKADRDPNTKRPTEWKSFYLPFTNHTKKKIAEIYHSEGIMDLLPLTRSCESLDNIGTQHCGKCWWCQERAWAFDLTSL